MYDEMKWTWNWTKHTFPCSSPAAPLGGPVMGRQSSTGGGGVRCLGDSYYMSADVSQFEPHDVVVMAYSHRVVIHAQKVCVCAWISSLFSWCSWWCGPAVHMWAWLTCTLWCTSAWIKGSGNWVTASDQMWHFFLHLNSIWIIRPASESLHRICLKPSSRTNYCCWY